MKRLARSIVISVMATVLAVIAGACLVAIIGASDSADLVYKSMHYDVQMQSNGDLRIKQRVTMRLQERSSDESSSRYWKQLYQQYTLKATNLMDITDISVTNITSGQQYSQIDPENPAGISTSTWNEEYANHWYIADVTESDTNPEPYVRDDAKLDEANRTIEIGWNIPATESADELTFEIDMTMVGTSTAYRDVASFQWEPFGPLNQVPIGKVTGVVNFPEGVNENNSWAWLHFAGNGQTSRGDNGQLQFTAYDVKPGQHLDLVAMVDSSATHDVARSLDVDHKQAIIDDETEQERQWYESQSRRASITVAIWIVLAITGIVVSIWGLVAAIRSNRAARFTGDVVYWRDPPEMSPASASRLHNVLVGEEVGSNPSRQMAATVLSLACKGVIAIYPGKAEQYAGINLLSGSAHDIAFMASQGKNKTSTIVIKQVDEKLPPLSSSEEAAFAMLDKTARSIGSRVFDLDDMKAQFSKGDEGYKLNNRFDVAVRSEFAMLGATRTVGVGARVAGSIGILAAIMASVMFFIQGVGMAMSLAYSAPVMCISIFNLVYARRRGLTERAGQRYAGQVQGLKHYLEDYSDFSDRDTGDLLLWDRYLVYATAFGISGKVLKQLAMANPQLMDPQWMDQYASGTMLYWMYRPMLWNMGGTSGVSVGNAIPNFTGSAFGGFSDLGTQLSSSFATVKSTWEQAAWSERAGSGGGFSGSGGGFSGGSFGGSSGGSGGGSFGGR